MEIKNVVLASASPRRKELLLQIGIQPEIVVSHVVEQVTSSVPSEVVMELASQKAADVAAGRKAGETVIGSGVFIIPLIFRDAQQNLSALRRKLKGIGKQIYQHLAQTNGIAQQNAFVD